MDEKDPVLELVALHDFLKTTSNLKHQIQQDRQEQTKFRNSTGPDQTDETHQQPDNLNHLAVSRIKIDNFRLHISETYITCEFRYKIERQLNK